MHKIEAHILDQWSHLKSVHLFVACSGGLDSMVLLHVFRTLGFDVSVLHVNYQLRGEDSDLDQKCVETYCSQYTIPFKAIVENVNPAQNLQESAREIRYRWFDANMREIKGSKTLLAHHADDQVETFFMHLARKSGILGMACMPAAQHNYIRPLLPFSKSDLLEYAVQKNIVWREDTSNASSKYRRNFLRNEVLPKLYQSHPELKESVITLISAFQQTQLTLETTVAPALKHIRETNHLPFALFDQLSREAHFELFREFGVSGKALEEINKLRNAPRGKRFDLHNRFYTSIVKEEAGFSFLRPDHSPIFLHTEEVAELPNVFSKTEIFLDKSLVSGTLSLRFPKKGDRISPLGMTGSQLIADILKDAKIDANTRSKALVLCDDTAIHWLVGYKIGRLAIATHNSARIVKCTISEEAPE